MNISLIIPTRERAFYLGAAIRTALDIPDPDIEIIVADNASQDDTRAVVAQFSDPRLVYLPSDRRVSMRENFNRALVASCGDYVIFFGDDDAILPGQFAHLRRLLTDQNPDGVSWFKTTYGWPIQGYGKKTGGVRFYRQDCFGAPHAYDPGRDLDKLLQCRLGELVPTPNIYHGCISRRYFDAIAPGKQLFFDGTIPDVNLQYRSIFQGGRFVHTRHPFTINGYGPASTGGAHKAPAPGSASAEVGAHFVAENKADPYDDIIDHALNINLVFFATLETLRSRSGFENHQPNYQNWYQYALNAGRNPPVEAAKVNAILDRYATATGTQGALAVARGMQPRAKRSLAERLARLRSQVASFRLSAAIDGVNTVHTAARVCDAVLGDDYGAVLDGTLSPHQAWARARTRSRGFKRTL